MHWIQILGNYTDVFMTSSYIFWNSWCLRESVLRYLGKTLLLRNHPFPKSHSDFWINIWTATCVSRRSLSYFHQTLLPSRYGAKSQQTAKLCLEFPIVGWKKTFSNTLIVNTHSQQCISTPPDISNPGAHRWEPAGKCSLIRSQACTLPHTLHPNAMAHTCAHTHPSIRSVPNSRNPTWSVPADQGGPGDTHFPLPELRN